MAGIFGDFLEANAEVLELTSVLDVSLEENNCADAVVSD